MKPTVSGIHHVSLLVENTRHALGFYRGILGLKLSDARPELGFPGAWLELGDNQQIHLLQLPNPDPRQGRPQHGGLDRHIALLVQELEVLRAALDEAGVAYSRSGSGRRAIFCRDPDGNALEFIEAEPG
jgi:glyoxylase I family protein